MRTALLLSIALSLVGCAADVYEGVELWSNEVDGQEIVVLLGTKLDGGEDLERYSDYVAIFDGEGTLLARANQRVEDGESELQWLSLDAERVERAKKLYEEEGGGDYAGWGRVPTEDMQPGMRAAYERLALATDDDPEPEIEAWSNEVDGRTMYSIELMILDQGGYVVLFDDNDELLANGWYPEADVVEWDELAP